MKLLGLEVSHKKNEPQPKGDRLGAVHPFRLAGGKGVFILYALDPKSQSPRSCHLLIDDTSQPQK